MKKITKSAAAAVAAVLLFSLTASASVCDTRIFSHLLGSATLAKICAPIIYTAENSARLCLESAKKDAEAPAEKIDRGHLGYVVSANQRLNMDTGLYFAELVLINETGCFEVSTVDDVENYSFMPLLTTERIGSIPEWEGKFIQFDMRDTDKIYKLELRYSQVQTEFSSDDGFYLVNVMDMRNDILSFYDTAEDVTIGEKALSQRLSDDGYAIISVDGEQYLGSFLSKISSKQTKLFSRVGNAVIQISKGEIVRVFSFDGGYEV